MNMYPIALVTIFAFLRRMECAEAVTEDPVATPGQDKPWYRFDIHAPYILLSYNQYSFGSILFACGLAVLCALLLLPYGLLAGAQCCLTAGLGTYFFAMHILAQPLNFLLLRIPLLGSIIGFVIAVGAMILSINEKFSTLFLSIGSGYIITLLLFTLLNFFNYFLYIFTFVPVFFAYGMSKKFNKEVHYLVAKAFVLAYSASLIIYLCCYLPLFSRVMAPTQTFYMTNLLSLLIFMGLFGVFYAFAFLKEKLQERMGQK